MHPPPTLLHQSPAVFNGENRLPALFGAGAYNAPQGRDFPAHQHSVWEIVYYRAGNILCPVGDTVYAGQPGVVLSTPPGTIHAEVAVTAYANFFIQLDAPPGTPWPIYCLDDSDRTLESVCSRIVRESQSQTLDSEAMVGLLIAELDLLLRRAARQEPVPETERIVRLAERLLTEHAAESPTLTGIARQLGVSPATLRAYFARCRPYSPREYRQQAQLRGALTLLQTSDLPLEAVARFCGYDSASHLSRQVKQRTGQTPGALRRQARNQQQAR